MKRDVVVRLLQRLRPAAVNLSLVLVSMSMGLAAAEGLVRLVAPEQLILYRSDLWQPADTVGWLHVPNVSTRINTGERTVSVFTDAEGFRVGVDGPTAGSVEVLFLGDSFIEALQVEHEQSAAGLLEVALSATTGDSVAIRNAGVGGWGPNQYLLRARSLLARADYDLVVTAVFLRNDVVAQHLDYFPPRMAVERYRLRLPRSLRWIEVTDAVLRPTNDFLEVRSHLYLFFRNRLQTLRMKLGLSPLNFPQHFLKSQGDSPRWQVTADICNEINDLAVRHGGQALFVLIPAAFQVDSANLMSYVSGFDMDLSDIDLEQPNRRLGRELTLRGLRVLDALPDFRAAHDRGQRLYGRVDPHLSPDGNALLARVIAPAAADLLSTNRRDQRDPSTPR